MRRYEEIGCIAALAIALGLASSATAEAARKKNKALSLAELSEQAAPAVVAIDRFDENRKSIGTAAGFIASPEGRIITNVRTVLGARSLTIRLNGGDAYDSVALVELDARRDIAILEIKAIKLPALPLGDSDEVETGQKLFSINTPAGSKIGLQEVRLEGTQQSAGSKYLQLPAAVTPGGPVLTERGEVIGIAVNPRKDAASKGLAVPVNYARPLVGSNRAVPVEAFYEATKKALLSAAQQPRQPGANTPPGGVPGGVAGGVPGGVIGGIIAAPPPPPPPPPLSAPFTDRPSRQTRDQIARRLGFWTVEDAKLALGNPLAENRPPVSAGTRTLEFEAPGTMFSKMTLRFLASTGKLSGASFTYSARPQWSAVARRVRNDTSCQELQQSQDGQGASYSCIENGLSYFVPPDGALERVDVTAGTSPPAANRPQQIRVGSTVQAAKLVRQPRPVYPPLAKQGRIQGTVRFNAVIAKDGTVQTLNLISGHPLLVPAATDAVKQWVYQPTLLNGEPVEVLTQIDANFTLSQ